MLSLSTDKKHSRHLKVVLRRGDNCGREDNCHNISTTTLKLLHSVLSWVLSQDTNCKCSEASQQIKAFWSKINCMICFWVFFCFLSLRRHFGEHTFEISVTASLQWKCQKLVVSRMHTPRSNQEWEMLHGHKLQVLQDVFRWDISSSDYSLTKHKIQ